MRGLCVLVTLKCHAKAAELIKMPFGEHSCEP